MFPAKSNRAAFVGLLLVFAAVGLADALSLSDGVFTAEQAERGAQVYEQRCLACHDENFYRAKLLVWQGAPVGDFFFALTATMPSENPGSLSDEEYFDVLAYIFSITGAPAGRTELGFDNMDSIEIVAPMP